MSARNSAPRDFIPHGCIPADLYRKVMVEVENVIGDPNHVQGVALWIDGIHECKFIARDDEQFKWATDSACDLMDSTERDLFGGDTYVFVTVLDETDYYLGWVHYDSNEVVALHKSDCDLLQVEAPVAEEHHESEGGTKHEVWVEQGKTLTYWLSVHENSTAAGVDGTIMAALDEIDAKSMSAEQIAEHVNAALDAWDERVMETSDVEPNYALLGSEPVDVAGYKVRVSFRYSSERVTVEEVFEKVKMPHYEAVGIDRDFAEILENLPQPKPARRGSRR